MTIRGEPTPKLAQGWVPLVAIRQVLPKMIVPARQSVLGDQDGGICRPPDLPATEARNLRVKVPTTVLSQSPAPPARPAAVRKSHYHTEPQNHYSGGRF